MDQRRTSLTKESFRIFRNALKYGDCFFVRDPETMKWLYIDNAKVDRIVVNESEGKKPEQYVIRDINPNLQRLSQQHRSHPTKHTVAVEQQAVAQRHTDQVMQTQAQRMNMSGFAGGQGGRFYKTMNAYNINAEHVVHMSMSDGSRQPISFWTVSVGTSFQSLQTKRTIRRRNNHLQGTEST